MVVHSNHSSHRFLFRILCLILALSFVLAAGSSIYAADPVVPAPTSPRLMGIAAGEQISVALNDRGQLFSWGYNWNGQLGDGMDGWGLAKPKPGIILKDIVAVSAGAGHTLALSKTGVLYAFGYGWDGQNGTGAAGMRSTLKQPAAIMTEVYTMSAGAAHSLVVTSDGALYAFGRNRHGELGNTNTTSQTRPLKTITENVYSASAGDRHSLAILKDGTLLSWGDNYAGQLGTGDQQQRLSPVKVMDEVYRAYAGRVSSFAIKSDSSLWGWGKGITALINAGADSEQIQSTPLKIMDDVREVAIGANHLLILKNDGTLYAAGENWLGQLGLPGVQASSVPLLVKDKISAISAGGWHSMALEESGELLTWGDNTYGQLGNMSLENAYTPTRIQVNNLAPSVLFNGSGAGWTAVRPKLAVDRVVLPLQATFVALNIPHKLFGNVLQFTHEDKTYTHLISSNIFYCNSERVSFPMVTQSYQGEIVFQAYNTVEMFGFIVRWDPTAQLLMLEND